MINKAITGLPLILSLTEEKVSYREKYPFLDSELPVDQWWDSLDFSSRLETGSLSIHFGYMTANCCWGCVESCVWDVIKISQRRRIKKVYKRRNDQYFMFDPYALFNCQ